MTYSILYCAAVGTRGGDEDLGRCDGDFGGRVNISTQSTLAVAIIRIARVTIAPIVMVSPLNPSKKKL